MLYIRLYHFSLFLLFLCCIGYVCGIARIRQICSNISVRFYLVLYSILSGYLLFFIQTTITISPPLHTFSWIFHTISILLNIILFFHARWRKIYIISFFLGYSITSLVLYIFLIRWNWMYLYVHLSALRHFAAHYFFSLILLLFFLFQSQKSETKVASIFAIIWELFFGFIPEWFKERGFIGKIFLFFYRLFQLCFMFMIFVISPILTSPVILNGVPSIMPTKSALWGSGTVLNMITNNAEEFWVKSSASPINRSFPCTGAGWICTASYPACEKGYPYYFNNSFWKHDCWRSLIFSEYMGGKYLSFRFCYRSIGTGNKAFFQILVEGTHTCRYYPERKIRTWGSKRDLQYISSEIFSPYGGFKPEANFPIEKWIK